MSSTFLTSISHASKLALGLAGCAAAAVVAYAAVTFDDAGCGFVGKGDVKNAFGWSNAQLDANAASVSFTYESLSSYEAVCAWTTGEGTRGEQTHRITRTVYAGVESALVSAVRKNPQDSVTGFVLCGFVDPQVGGDEVPVVGDPCIGQGTGATYVSVEPVADELPGGLYIHHNGVKVLLEPTL
jgi:hypothetical protein